MPVYPSAAAVLPPRRGVGFMGLGQTSEIDAKRAELEQLRAEREALEVELVAARSGVEAAPVRQPAPTATPSAKTRAEGAGLLRAGIEIGGRGSTASTYNGAVVAVVAASAAVIYLAFFRGRR